jgi:zinc protease
MVRYPIQLALRAAFGESRYGLPAHGLPESVPALTDGMVRAWHACELAVGRTVVVAVGEFEPERFAGHLAGLFASDVSRSDAPPPRELPATGFDARQAIVERVKRQSALAMLFPGPSRSDPTRFAGEVWSAIASGLGGKLFMALRERRSLAYTVFASSWQRLGAGALLLYLATSPEREEEAREALLGELTRFGERPPEEEELARAVSYLSGQVAVQRQAAGSVAAEIVEAWLMGNGLSDLLDPAAGYRAVTAEAVRQLAADSLVAARRVEGIVRGG